MRSPPRRNRMSTEHVVRETEAVYDALLDAAHARGVRITVDHNTAP